MARKSAKNSGGCASAIGGVFLIGLGIAVVSGVFNIIKCIFIGVKLRYPYILRVIALYCFYRLGYYLTHRKPLTYEQIKRLARRNAEKYVKETYRFKKEAVVVDPNFKAALDVTGRWYEIEEPVATFPAYVAALLKGKRHEWVVIAVERNGCVCSFWANKGEDSESVSFNCDIDEIIQKCKELGGYSVFRFHNHPNPDPAHYTTLLASAQDKLSAASCAQAVCQHGINWFDFVCARGDYIQFYSQISDDFEVDGKSTSDIIDKISITPEMDYALQKEYSQSNHLGMLLRHVVVAILVIVLLGSSYGAGHKYINNSNAKDGENLALNDARMGELINPSQDYVIEVLKEVPGINKIETVTEENDTKHLLGSENGCSSVIYFTYSKIDQNEFGDESPATIGTDGGGCVEVFYKVADAESRLTTLRASKMLSGSSYLCGSVIIRTSRLLSKNEQEVLQNLILTEMISDLPDKADNNAAAVVHMEPLSIPDNLGSATLEALGAYALSVTEEEGEYCIPPGKYVCIPVFPESIHIGEGEEAALWDIYISDDFWETFDDIPSDALLATVGGLDQTTAELVVSEGQFVYVISRDTDNKLVGTLELYLIDTNIE